MSSEGKRCGCVKEAVVARLSLGLYARIGSFIKVKT